MEEKQTHIEKRFKNNSLKLNMGLVFFFPERLFFCSTAFEARTSSRTIKVAAWP